MSTGNGGEAGQVNGSGGAHDVGRKKAREGRRPMEGSPSNNGSPKREDYKETHRNFTSQTGQKQYNKSSHQPTVLYVQIKQQQEQQPKQGLQHQQPKQELQEQQQQKQQPKPQLQKPQFQQHVQQKQEFQHVQQKPHLQQQQKQEFQQKPKYQQQKPKQHQAVRGSYAPGICYKFKSTGTCSFGDACKFSHEIGKIGAPARDPPQRASRGNGPSSAPVVQQTRNAPDTNSSVPIVVSKRSHEAEASVQQQQQQEKEKLSQQEKKQEKQPQQEKFPQQHEKLPLQEKKHEKLPQQEKQNEKLPQQQQQHPPQQQVVVCEVQAEEKREMGAVPTQSRGNSNSATPNYSSTTSNNNYSSAIPNYNSATPNYGSGGDSPSQPPFANLPMSPPIHARGPSGEVEGENDAMAPQMFGALPQMPAPFLPHAPALGREHLHPRAYDPYSYPTMASYPSAPVMHAIPWSFQQLQTAAPPNTIPCRYFMSGTCKYGISCRYGHYIQTPIPHPPPPQFAFYPTSPVGDVSPSDGSMPSSPSTPTAITTAPNPYYQPLPPMYPVYQFSPQHFQQLANMDVPSPQQPPQDEKTL